MIDFDDIDDYELVDPDYDVQSSDCVPGDDGGGGGFGWGMFLGGAMGWLLGGGGSRPSTEYVPVDADLGAFKEDEKEFLAQVWRFEQEIDSAWQANQWERLFCLLHAASASLNDPWAKFLPEHPEYNPSEKMHVELDQHVMPLLDKMKEGARLDFISLIPPERIKELEDGDLSMDYESMAFTLNGQPVS